MQLFPGLWFSHAGQLVTVELVVRPSPLSSLARVQILRPYCDPNHHLVPPCSSLLNPFSCCSAVPLCNTTGGCSTGQYWCHLLEACLPTTSPCSPYDSAAGGRGFTLPPRYPAIPPFYHLVADLSLRINPSSELKTMSIMVYPDDVVAIQHTRDSGTFLHCLNSEASLNSSWRQSYLSLRGAEWGGWWQGGLTSLTQGGRWVDGVVCDLRMLYMDTIHRGTELNDIFDFTHTQETTALDIRPLTPDPTPSLRSEFRLNVIHPLPDEKNQIHVQINSPTLIVIKVLSGQNARSSWSAPVLQTGVPFLPSCSFTAKVEGGSSVKFTWVIDNLEKFAYEGESYTVVFKKPAEHKLRVTASNRVSSQSQQFLLTADEMTPLAEPEFKFVREVVAVNATHLYTLRVKVDTSMPVTFDYTLHVQVSNQYDNIGASMKINVRPKLSHVHISSSPPVPLVKHTLLLEASAEPSTHAVFYTWEFGDGSKPVHGNHHKVHHSFGSAGFYNITVCANNTLTTLTAWLILEVMEKISGLTISCSELSEVSSATDFRAKVATGTSLIWDFDFGDGSLRGNLTDGSISHIYKSPGNYTAVVTVSNSVSKVHQSIRVEVYSLAVSGVLPKECVIVGKDVQLTALVTGKISILSFHWQFGDGAPLTVVTGQSTVMHSFPSEGAIHVSLTVFSSLTSVSFNTSICVEAPITSMAVQSSQDVAAVGEEVCFRVFVSPEHMTGYQYKWFSNFSSLTSKMENSQRCFVFKDEGVEEVSVMANNKVSNKTGKVAITIQKPVSKLSLAHDSQSDTLTVNTLASFWVANCTGSNVSVMWDFGDGSPVEQKQNVSHVFTSTGNFTVTATAFNVVSRDSATLKVHVLLPVTDLSLHTNQSYAVVGEETLITALTSAISSTNYYWTVDGITSTKQGTYQFRFAFPKPGLYQVRVIAQNLVSSREAAILIEVFERIEGLEIDCHGLTNMKYTPTQEELLFIASITKGSNVTYHWLAAQGGINREITGDGKLFHLFAESPGRISVQLRASNKLGEATSIVFLETVERVRSVHITTQSNIVALGKLVNISVSVVAGSELEYLWYVNSDPSPLQTHAPFLLHTFTSLGHRLVTVSVHNVFSQCNNTKQFIVQEEVQEVDFEIEGKTHPFFINTSTAVTLHGLILKGSDLHWDWKVRGAKTNLFNATNQTFLYTFTHVDIYQVSLNVSNGINWQMVSHRVTVQDGIEGLLLNISKSSLCIEEEVTFTPTVSIGSNVSFVITFRNIDWIHSQDILKGQFSTSSLPAGRHLVTVKAWNLVSSAEVSSSILVTEHIQGLRLVNCCSTVLEALKGTRFKAEVQSGFPINYTWIFHSVGSKPTWLTGREVIFTPQESGILSVSVIASDGVCSQMLNETASVEWPVKKIKLICHSERVFVGYAVKFSATVNGGSNVRYLWDFGDSTEVLVTDFGAVNHTYYVAGKYSVMAKVLNSVSHVSTQLHVEVEELQCSSPEASLVQSQATIYRSRPSFFEASVDINCSTYKTIYKWEIFAGSDCTNGNVNLCRNNVILISPVDASSPLLLLPKHTLDVGQHRLVFTVSLQGTPVFVQRTTNITVVRSPLVAVIKGGSHKLWPCLSDLIMDGSESQDPDVEPGVEHALEYHWTFMRANSSRMTVLGAQQHPGTVYIFTLTVHKAGRNPASVNQTYKWSAEDQTGMTLDLDEVTTSTGRHSPNLVVRSGVLQPGLSYTFTLNVSQPGGGQWGSDSLTVPPNTPPHGGVCDLSPQSGIRPLETVVTYTCSWQDDESEASQLIYTFQVAPCRPISAMCPTLTLRNKSQTELWALVQHGNPQEIIPYSIALTSQLNQARELEDRREIRGNVSQALASLSMSSLLDVDQISSALAQSTAVPRELVCKGCQEKVLEAVGRMIHVMETEMRPGVLSALETGRNILNVINSSRRCQFHIPTSLIAHLKSQRSEVVQVLFGVESSPMLTAADPPISTSLVAMELTTPQGEPIPIRDLDLAEAIQVTLPHKHLVGQGDEGGDGRVSEDRNGTCLTVTLPAEGQLKFTVKAVDGLDENAGLYISFNFSLTPVSVCVFSSLCQYYSVTERRWSSEGLRPLEGSTLHAARCLTQHLTMFGASLFVHPGAVVLLPPLQSGGPMGNIVVGIVCAALVVIHLLVGLIAHKLDHLDSVRLSQVPLCGRPGLYHYRVLVKTGWRRGATTAHVGISLYGVNKSGSRHLQRDGAFQRGGLDQFHLETDHNLGEVWKLRIWHDNTLDPSWYVQHVVVWDPQTDHMFFFVLEDWLSVENQKSETVEREILASPEELTRFRRVLASQLMFGVMERHLWLSLWERPTHSCFTRGQRVTCSALVLHLYLALGALWYGAVGSEGSVTVDMSVPPSPVCHSVEMDVYLGQSELSGPSFLSLVAPDIQSTSCSSWSDQSEDKSLCGAEIHMPDPRSCSFLCGEGLYKCPSVQSVDSVASTFLPSPSPDSTRSSSTTRIVARGQPSWLLPPWALAVIYPLVAVLLGTCLTVVGLYGSFFSRQVVLMWLISALSAFLTSALLLEPLKVCVQALVYTALWRPVDPEVEEQLARETTVVRALGEQCGKVRPPCGYGLLQAKEEARKAQALRSLMRHCVCQLLFLLLVLMVNYQDSIERRQGRLLHSSIRRHLHTAPLGVPWSDAEQWINHTLVPHLHRHPPLHFKSLSVDFTHYHRESGLFVCVSVQLEWAQTQRVTPFLSIHPLLIPSSFSGLDLQVALMVLLLVAALLILLGQLWSMVTERAQYLHQCRHWFQLLLALLSLATVILQFCFLLGTLRFVRRWVVIGRVLQRAWGELWALIVLLLLLLVLCTHLGNTLFSRSVEGFLSVQEAGVSVLSILRGRVTLQQLCKVHTVLGSLYGLLLMGGGLWLLARLCGAVLIHTYFRHRVKFEGMDIPPSRSSQESRLSTFSSTLPSSYSPSLSSSFSSPRPPSSALSVRSEDSSVSEPGFDVSPYLDRLAPCVTALLSRFDRVNQITEDIHNLEMKLEEAQ
uniref:Polycystin-1-like n=1 Tax=Seriola lalandi dorsalis TaxID=1841481 RepID=A0A3B4YDK7_SERLL